MKNPGFLALAVIMTVIVSASLLNSAVGFYQPPEKIEGYLIGKTAAQPAKGPSPQVQAGPQPNPQPAPQQPAAGSTVKLAYKNYAYYFPDSGSDTITVKKGQKVTFEGVLSGQEALVGCMKSIRTPWGTKVFRPGDSLFSFTPQKEGRFGFSCGMGMGTGSVIVQN